MTKVYFKEMKDLDNKELVDSTIYEMLDKIVTENNIKLEKKVPLKVHFGEKGNTTFITPDNFDGVKRYLKDNGIESCYMDTNVLYKGSRTKTKDHIKTAHEHGFTDLDVIIADGDEENPYHEVEINLKQFDKCKIGTKYKDYNQYIVLCHFKGHIKAGIGSAIKQLAMGFASRGGKMHQHSASVPKIKSDACISCETCIDSCPANAIYMDDKAHIDKNKCLGCAACTIKCPVNAITNTWDSDHFNEKLAEYAYAAAKDKTNIYITYVMNITQNCDCSGEAQTPIAENIGILASIDPVALDKAAFDKFKEINNDPHFAILELTLEYAEEIGLGTSKYELINMD